MTETFNKAMIFFVLLVVILSVVFTWQALDVTFQKTVHVSNTGSFEKNNNLIKSGVGINIVPKEGGN